MIIVNVKEFSSIEPALKIFKNKILKTHLIKNLRKRQSFTKPSIRRREEILGARYREKIGKEPIN